MAESKSLSKAVKGEVKEAVHEAQTGNVKTQSTETAPNADTETAPADQPTYTRRHQQP